MATKRLSNLHKTRRAFGRAFAMLAGSIPLVHRIPSTFGRITWLDVLMPWRLLPQPVALSLIGLVALAMVCTDPAPGTWGEPTEGLSDLAIEIIEACADKGGILDMTDGVCVMPATVGGTTVPPLACEEDQVIGFVGIPDTLVCVQFDETEADVDGCVSPAFFSEELTHCVLPDGGLPCASGHEEIGGKCIPFGYGTPVCQPAPRNDGLPPDTHCLMHPLVTPTPAPEAAFDNDGCDPPNTWAGSTEAGYDCVPLTDLEQEGGRTGQIIVTSTGGRVGGTVAYHTAPCHGHDTVLEPPYADVTLCVASTEWAAVH